MSNAGRPFKRPRPLGYGRLPSREPAGCGQVASVLAGLVTGFLAVTLGGPFVLGAVISGKDSGGEVIVISGVGIVIFVAAASTYPKLWRRNAAAVLSRRFLIGLLIGGGVGCLVAGACFTALNHM